jgi:putative FmdB family regulatory protein
MPTYDYRCEQCGHEFELFQSMTAKLKRKCPECSEPKLKRLIGTGGAVIFKGSGFYETDYRSDSYKKAAEADKKKTEKKDEKKDSAKDAKKPVKDATKPAKKKDDS